MTELAQEPDAERQGFVHVPCLRQPSLSFSRLSGPAVQAKRPPTSCGVCWGKHHTCILYSSLFCEGDSPGSPNLGFWPTIWRGSMITAESAVEGLPELSPRVLLIANKALLLLLLLERIRLKQV